MSYPQDPSMKGTSPGQLSKTQSCQVCGKPRLHNHSIWVRSCSDCSVDQTVSKSYANSVMPEKQHLKVTPGAPPVQKPELKDLHKPGAKDDGGKPRWDLLPWKAMAGLVGVLTFGVRKYSPNGWRTVPNAKERYLAALLRHLHALSVGETLDPESGLRHIDHALCNVAFLAELED